MTYRVLVIRPAPCCGSTKGMGRVLEVVRTETTSMRCVGCLSVTPTDSAFVVDSEGKYMLASRVKRLPPPEEEPINLAVSEEIEA
jgi:hypothetical protein